MNGEDTARAYQMLHHAKNRFNDNDNASLVNAIDFVNLYPIFAFDLSAMDPLLFNDNSCDLEVRMRRAGNSELLIYALVKSDREMVVSQAGTNVTIEQL